MYEAFHSSPWEWNTILTSDPRVSFAVGVMITLSLKCGAFGLFLRLLKYVLPSSMFFPIFLGVTLIKVASKKALALTTSAIKSLCSTRRPKVVDVDETPKSTMRKPRVREVPSSQFSEFSSLPESSIFTEQAESEKAASPKLTCSEDISQECNEEKIDE